MTKKKNNNNSKPIVNCLKLTGIPMIDTDILNGQIHGEVNRAIRSVIKQLVYRQEGKLSEKI